MKRAIRAHLRDFLAVLGLFVIAVAVAGYILEQQRLRFPLIEPQPKRLAVELDNAQAVTPGQGQTVRVAGVEIGKIGEVELEDGYAVVQLEIEEEFETVIREDATALLRPKTALKDMFLEVSPGTGKVLEEGGRIPLANTAPDVDPDEVYEALDDQTRPYLKLLVAGAGKGLENRGEDLRQTLQRFEPLHRDIARVARAGARRRDALKRLVHNYGVLVDALGDRPAELRRLVTASRSVFDAMAGEEQNISTAVSLLPGTLRQTESALRSVDTFADELGPALDALRPPFRRLDETNELVRPFLRETTPILRDEIRPFVRAAQPWTDDLRVAATSLARATPDLTSSFRELNRLFNMGAYNPGGAEPLTGDPARDRERQEGFLYWLAWTAQNTTSLFSTADAQGSWRRTTICGLPPSVFGALLSLIAADVGVANPEIVQELFTPGGPVDQLVQTQFGICDFNALPAGPLDPSLIPEQIQNILDGIREPLGIPTSGGGVLP